MIQNMRDLGGIRTMDGKQIRPGLLVRSESRDGSGKTIYTMRTQRIERMTPDESAFALPQGAQG